MKKLISVLLTICMLVLAMGMATAEETIYNNGEAPNVVRIEGGIASVKDAQDAVVAVIPDDGQLKVVYVGDRDEQNPEIEALLNAALDTFLESEYVVTDLFYVEIPEAYADDLAAGGAVEMIFEPLILRDDVELMVLKSEDGINWVEDTEAVVNNDGTVTVQCDKNGLVAFVIVPGGFAVVDKPDTTLTETNPNFTPSVTGKPDPKLVEIEVEGETGVAVITDADGEVLDVITDLNTVVVTSLFERVYNPDVVTYEHLQAAYDMICAAPDLGALADETEEETLADEIASHLEGTGLTSADMTVSDLFKVTVYGGQDQFGGETGKRIEVTLDRTFRQDEIVMVLCAVDTDHWTVLDDQYVTINEDGTLTLSLEEPGVYALLVERLDADMDAEGAVMAP